MNKPLRDNMVILDIKIRFISKAKLYFTHLKICLFTGL